MVEGNHGEDLAERAKQEAHSRGELVSCPGCSPREEDDVLQPLVRAIGDRGIRGAQRQRTNRHHRQCGGRFQGGGFRWRFERVMNG